MDCPDSGRVISPYGVPLVIQNYPVDLFKTGIGRVLPRSEVADKLIFLFLSVLTRLTYEFGRESAVISNAFTTKNCTEENYTKAVVYFKIWIEISDEIVN